MKQIIKRGMLILLCITLVGCNQIKEKQQKSNGAMGRYLEEASGLEDIIQDNDSFTLWNDSKGALNVIFNKEEIEMYQLQSAGEWKKVEDGVCEVINREHPEILSIDMVSATPGKDTLYLYGNKLNQQGEKEDYIGKFQDNQFSEIKIEWQSDRPIIMEMVIDSDENIILYDHTQPYVLLYSNDGKLKKKLGQEAMRPAVLDNKLYCMGRNKIEVYDLDTYELERTVEEITCFGREDIIFSNHKDAIFVATAEGIFRINNNHNIVEKIIEGQLCSLSSYYIGTGATYNDEIYISYTGYDKAGNDKLYIKKYVYHSDIPTVPNKQIIIWAPVSTELLRNTATVLKERHPDTYVKLEVLYDENEFWENDYEIQSEDLEALSTQLLAGQGPDLMILDGLPIESYRKQGFLTDLSSCLETSRKQGALLDQVVEAYQADGEIYAIPLEFNLTMAIGDEELLKDGFSLLSLADYQENHPEGYTMFPMNSEDRVRQMATYWQKELFNENGTVNKEKLAKYLKAINIISSPESKWSKYNWSQGYSVEGSVINNIVQADLSVITSINQLQSILDILDKAPDCTIVGKVEGGTNMVCGLSKIGLNANSKNQELAKEFIEIALSEELQGKGCEGLPVNIDALNELLLYANHSNYANYCMYESYYYNDEGKLDMNLDNYGYDFDASRLPNEMPVFLEACKKSEVIKLLEPAIYNILKEETEAYFRGKKTLEKTVDDIDQKVKLYISEQS